MAQEKSASPLPKLRPLPIRVARLHSKLLISALVGIAVLAILPDDWRLPTRLLAGRGRPGCRCRYTWSYR